MSDDVDAGLRELEQYREVVEYVIAHNCSFAEAAQATSWQAVDAPMT